MKNQKKTNFVTKYFLLIILFPLLFSNAFGQCLITSLNVSIGACQPATSTFSVTGTIGISTPPGTGTLIAKDCNGNQTTVATAPFGSSSYNFTIPNITADGAPCSLQVYFSSNPGCNQSISYSNPVPCFPPCNIDSFSIVNTPNCSANWESEVAIYFSAAPTSGDLVVQDCQGNITVIQSYPFSSPATGSFATTANSATPFNCTYTTYFTDNTSCSNPVTFSPLPAINPDEAGTFTPSMSGDGTHTYILCDGDQFQMVSNGDESIPPIAPGNDPSVVYFLYSCPPTTSGYNIDPTTDPCFAGYIGSSGFSVQNNGGNADPLLGSLGTLTNQTYYVVPMTLGSLSGGLYQPCYDLAVEATQAVQYLNPITYNQTSDCQAGTVTISNLQGGYPEFYGGNYTASALTPGTASLGSTTAAIGGSFVISGLNDGDAYSFTITDGNGCPITISGTFVGTQNPSFSYPQNAYCTTAADPSPTITGVSGGTFSVSPAGLTVNSSTGVIDVSSAPAGGSFTITYTTPSPTCYGSTTFNVTINPQPTVSATPQSVCPGTQATLTGTGNATTYTWNNGVTNGVAFTPPAGTTSYTVTGTSAAGCTNTASVNVTTYTLPTANAGADKVLTCTTTSLNLDGTGSTSTGVTYSWAGPGITSGGNTATPTINAVGTYTLTVTNTTTGCTATDNVDVTLNNTPPIANAGIDTTLTCTRTSLNLDGTGSTPTGVTYNWTGGTITSGASTIAPTINAAGTYTLTVTNITNGCTATDAVNVTLNNTPPNANAGIDTTLTCTRIALNLAGLSSTGGATFSWSGPGITSGGATATPTINTAGTYTLTVTDPTNGCTATDNVDVTLNNTPPNVDAGPDQTLTCTNPTVPLAGTSSTSGATFNWTGGTIVSGGTTLTPDVSAAGTYTLTVTDPTNGCTATDNTLVNSAVGTPNVSAGADTVLTCTTIQAPLNGSSSTGGATFSWSGPGIVSGGTSATPIVNAVGTYTLTVTDPSNGCTATDAANVTLNNTPPIANAGADMVLTCTTTQVTLDGSGSTLADNYNWTGGTIVSGGTTTAPTVNAAGTYTLTVTDPINGCTATDATNVTLNNTPPIANAGADMVLTCTTTQVTLDGSGSTLADNYNWTGGTIVSGGTTTAPIVNAAGTYTLTVTDPTNGCTATDNVDVTLNNTPPNVDAGPDQTLTCTNPTVPLAGTSSTSGATFNWTGGTIVSGGTSLTPDVSAAGTYTLTVTDPTNGCTATDNTLVNSAVGTPNVSAGADTVLTCTTTQVTLNGSSTTAGVTFNWVGIDIVSGGTTQTPIVNTAGTYTLTVTDPTNGCTATDAANVTLNNTPPNINAGADEILTCATIQVTLNGTSTTGGTTYNWSGPGIVSGATTASPIVNAAGAYTITGTDPTNGCTATDNANVTVDNTLPTVNAGADQNVCEGTQVTLSASGSGGNYTWNNGVVNNTPFVPTDTTTYIVTGTGANGCTATDDVTVNVIPNPTVDFVADKLSGCSPLTTTFTNNSTGNLVGCQWSFSDGNSATGCGSVSETFINVGCYNVTLTVSTPEGCTNSMTKTNYVCVIPNPVADFNITPNQLTTSDTHAQLTNTSTGGDTYIWNFGDASGTSTDFSPSHSFPNDNSGTYTITLYVTSAEGCMDTTSQTIKVIEDLIFYVPNTFTPDNNDFNEIFKPIFTSGYDPYNYTLYIFDRWGEILFESHDTNVGWDGTYGGKLVQDGTYVWKIMFKRKDIDKHEIHVGHVNVLK